MSTSPALSPTGPEGAYASVNGLDLYFEVHGSPSDRRPLVLLHGGILTIGLSWGTTLDGFAAGRQVIAVELQGHGHTPDPDRPISIGVYADDVVALLDHLGVEQADLFGFSLGGLVAMDAAVRYPARVGSLVAAAIHFRPDGYHDDITDPALHERSTRMPTAEDFAEMRTAYEAVAPDPAHFDEFMARTGEQVVGPFEGWAPEILQAMPVPTLVLVGDHDFVRLDHAVAMFELLPDAQLAVFPGTTHMALTQDRARVLSTVLPFLDA